MSWSLGHVILVHAIENAWAVSTFLFEELGAVLTSAHLSDTQTTEVNKYFCTKANIPLCDPTVKAKTTKMLMHLYSKGCNLSHALFRRNEKEMGDYVIQRFHCSPDKVSCCARVFEW